MRCAIRKCICGSHFTRNEHGRFPTSVNRTNNVQQTLYQSETGFHVNVHVAEERQG
jgi:hypothetical protein